MTEINRAVMAERERIRLALIERAGRYTDMEVQYTKDGAKKAAWEIHHRVAALRLFAHSLLGES